MSQTLAYQSAPQNFNDAVATKTVHLTSVPVGARIQVTFFGWGGTVYPNIVVSDGTNTFTGVRSQAGVAGGRTTAELHYRQGVAAGDYDIAVTHSGGSGEKYGWFTVQVWTGGKTSGGHVTGMTGDGSSGTSLISNPSVTAAAASTAAGVAFAVLDANVAGSDAGVDAAAGTPATWVNLFVEQDANAEAAGSADYAVCGVGVTPSVNWGTLTAAARCAAILVFFEDADAPLAGGATAGATAAADLSATGSRQFSMTLYEADGITPAASKTGLWWSWWDTIAHVRTAAANASGTGASTDAAGVFTVTAPGGLSVGIDQGFGVISNQDATADGAELAYVGSFDVT